MKKSLKTAAICGTILLAVSLIIGIISTIVYMIALSSLNPSSYSDVSSLYLIQDQFKPLYLITKIISLMLVPFSVLFLYGFVVLGKRFNNKIVGILARALIVIAILGVIMNVISIFTGDIYPKPPANYSLNNFSFSGIASMMKQGVTSSPVYAPIFRIVGDSDVFFWTFYALVTLGFIALSVIFGIGIIKLKKNGVPLALVTGIFYILTIIGFYLVASILAIIMFFKASRKFEAEKTGEKIGKPVEKTVVKKAKKK